MKSMFYSKEKEFITEKKDMDFDYFEDDKQNDNMRLGASYCDEINGNVIGIFGYFMSKGFRKFGFMGFD